MAYDIQFKPKAIKDVESLSAHIQKRILTRIEDMSNDLKGIEGKTIIIYRIRHRREAYR